MAIIGSFACTRWLAGRWEGLRSSIVANDPINGVDPTGLTQTTCDKDGNCTTIETPEGEENSIDVTAPNVLTTDMVGSRRAPVRDMGL